MGTYYVVILEAWLIFPYGAISFKKYLINNIKCCLEVNPKRPEKCPLSMTIKWSLVMNSVAVSLEHRGRSYKVVKRVKER